MKTVSSFLCPVCLSKGRDEPLRQQEHAYTCSRGHSFDRAKSGYVNLLLPGDKHSKVPGDNKLMVTARQNFLNKDYYRPLADEAGRCLTDWITRRDKSSARLTILDAGCGEGYYTAHIRRVLTEEGYPFQLLGVDISKVALDKAAKRDGDVEYAVASVFRLPLQDISCDVLLNLFAPYCAEETQRVMRKGGLLLLAIPGERHLLELKNIVYDTPYANEVKDYALDGFALLDRRNLDYTMHLPCNEDIDSLFKMTPYYYKTGKKNQGRLQTLEALDVTASFELLVYGKIGGGQGL